MFLESLMWNQFNNAAIAPLSVLIPQLLLIGDFFQSSHTLAGVEWTLRIEMMFYRFMVLLKFLGCFNHKKWLPLILLCSACVLYVLPQISGKDVWIHGYFTLYAPFLLMGALIYLIEVDGANVIFVRLSLV